MNKLTLTKAFLARHVEEKIGIESSLALSIVEHFFEEIMQGLEEGKPVKLVGLGCLSVEQKNARPGRNPKTGENIPVKKRRAVKFQTSSVLRKTLNRLSLPHFGA